MRVQILFSIFFFTNENRSSYNVWNCRNTCHNSVKSYCVTANFRNIPVWNKDGFFCILIEIGSGDGFPELFGVEAGILVLWFLNLFLPKNGLTDFCLNRIFHLTKLDFCVSFNYKGSVSVFDSLYGSRSAPPFRMIERSHSVGIYPGRLCLLSEQMYWQFS